MALAPFPPPNRSYTSTRTLAHSPSLQLLLLRRSSRVVRFRTRCSHQSVQSETQPTRVPFDAGRKKWKPKPSFFEQIRGKWTSKTDSAREKFPWQLEEREPPRGQREDERLVSQEVSDKAVEISSERERIVDPPVTDGLVLAVSLNQSTLPPWVFHGYKASPEPICDDESEASRVGSEGGEIEEVRERLDDGKVVRAGKSISKVDFGGKFDTEDDQWEELSAVAPQQGENISLAFKGLRVSGVSADDEDHQENVEFEKLDVSGESGNNSGLTMGERRRWEEEAEECGFGGESCSAT